MRSHSALHQAQGSTRVRRCTAGGARRIGFRQRLAV
jgi:hypothetical protein